MNKRMPRGDALRLGLGEFVDSRPNDRFGMIGFAYDCWLTGARLRSMAAGSRMCSRTKRNTRPDRPAAALAVGNGILAGVELLKKAKGPSKIMILATDGESNAGVSSGGRGKGAEREYPHLYLRHGLRRRGGKFPEGNRGQDGRHIFQHIERRGTEEACRQIDRLETSKFEQKKFRIFSELYPWFAGLAFVVLLADLVARHTFRMRVP